jgi:hypothetical protein
MGTDRNASRSARPRLQPRQHGQQRATLEIQRLSFPEHPCGRGLRIVHRDRSAHPSSPTGSDVQAVVVGVEHPERGPARTEHVRDLREDACGRVRHRQTDARISLMK